MYKNLDYEEKRRRKVRSDDRVLVLAPFDGTKPKSSTGLIDPRLFTGGNRLHAIRDLQTSLWSLRYDEGVLPPALKGQSFTSFEMLEKYTNDYFKTRNMYIKEVID